MSASDWDMSPQNNVSPTIVTDGDYVLQVDCNPGAGARKTFHMFYNGDVAIGPNSELDIEKKWITEQGPVNCLYVWLRANGIDTSAISALLVLWYGHFAYPNWYRRASIYHCSGGSATPLYASGNLIQWNLNFWRRLRFRVWDTIFPAGVVRYSIEYWTGAAWSLLLQWDDVSGSRKGNTGRIGIGCYGNTGVTSQLVRYNNADLGKETP